MRIALLFNGKNPATAEEHAAVALVARGQRHRFAGVQRLSIQLLVALVDEHYGVIGEAERTAAVFIHPTAHAEALWRQAALAVGVPVPDAAGAVFGAVFVPEQARRADIQFGEVDACSDCLCGAQAFRRILR